MAHLCTPRRGGAIRRQRTEKLDHATEISVVRIDISVG